MPHEDFDSDDNGNSEPELPPVKGLMLDRINDIMDYETEHIIFDRTTRADHFDCLERFWDLHPANSICYGRRYCLLYMCELLCICCSSSPYGDDGTPSPDLSTIQRDPLYGFNKARWETVQDDLKKVKKLLLRKDATINFTSGDDADEEGQGKQVDLGRAKSACFADKFQLVMDLISVNKMLGPIRKKLEDLIRANAGNFTKAIGKKHIQAVFDSVQEEKDMNSNLKKHILSLFVDRNSFVEDDKLTRLLNDKVFDLFKVQTRIERLIIAMWHQVYKGRVGHGVCTLMKLRYGIVRGSNIAKIVQRTPKQRTLGPEEEVRELRKTRKVLNDDHGNDPLDDALEATGGRKKKRRPLDPDETHSSRPAAMRRNKRKPDAPEDGFEDDQDDNMMPQDDNDDDEDDNIDKQMEYESEDDFMDSLNKEEKRDQVLLNRARKRDLEIENIPAEHRPDPGRFGPDGKTLKRFKWTNEEDMALKLGAEKEGVGNWTAVKRCFPRELRNRTALQIKDRYRTLFEKAKEKPMDREEQKDDSDVDEDNEGPIGASSHPHPGNDEDPIEDSDDSDSDDQEQGQNTMAV